MAPPGTNQPLRFLVVGVWNTAFGYLAFAGCWAASRALGWHYLAATLPAQLLAIGNAYLCHRLFVFGSVAPIRRSVPRYLAIYGGLYLLNTALLAMLVDRAGLHPLAASAVLLLGSTLLSYTAHRRYSFAPPPPPPSAPAPAPAPAPSPR